MLPNNYTLGVSMSKSQGVVTTPLGRRVTKKKKKKKKKRKKEDEGLLFHSSFEVYHASCLHQEMHLVLFYTDHTRSLLL